jgi:hypothetical protein
MKRTLRYAIALVSTVSLLLCGATILLGVRGYFVVDEFQHVHQADAGPADGQQTWSLQSGRGQLAFAVSTNNAGGEVGQRPRWYHDQPSHVIVSTPTGFAFERVAATIPPFLFVAGVVIVVPTWFVVFVTGLLPGIAVLRERRRRRIEWRRAHGLCVRCGYDLRESPGKCPECGAGYARRFWNRRRAATTILAPGYTALHATT